MTPPPDSNVDFSLTVAATSTEDDGNEITTEATLNVDVVGVADTPTVNVTDAVGNEDSAISLDVTPQLADGGRLGEHLGDHHHGRADRREPVAGYGLRWWHVDDHGPDAVGRPGQSDTDATSGLERRLLAGRDGNVDGG